MAEDAGKQESPSLEEFSKRLDAVRGVDRTEKAESEGRNKAVGQGFRLASELLAAMIVGPLLGWGFDRLTGVSPFGLLAGVFLGFAAGVRNVSSAMKENAESPEKADEN
ncbi:MAG: AtpZ/AtpI family protein [Parvularculaceae bacterium]